MSLSTQTVRVYLRFILTTQTKKKANLIPKNVHRVSKSIWRHDSRVKKLDTSQDF